MKIELFLEQGLFFWDMILHHTWVLIRFVLGFWFILYFLAAVHRWRTVQRIWAVGSMTSFAFTKLLGSFLGPSRICLLAAASCLVLTVLSWSCWSCYQDTIAISYRVCIELWSCLALPFLEVCFNCFFLAAHSSLLHTWAVIFQKGIRCCIVSMCATTKKKWEYCNGRENVWDVLKCFKEHFW